MFGWNRRKRRKKERGDVIPGVDVPDLGGGGPDGCGCDLHLIALTLIAGASLFAFAR